MVLALQFDVISDELAHLLLAESVGVDQIAPLELPIKLVHPQVHHQELLPHSRARLQL